MKTHIGKCDKCGKEVKLENMSMGYYGTPKDWLWVEGVGDLCPKCAKAYKKHRSLFLI